ncbi:GTA-gp10 family protein [Kordiimonas pumila]|uniref:GTA-gp10 family protein n=1 Tax=Kordiimonas pumila TaxID=2161677 RepID=A0ABV7D4A4_9PROT
MARKICGEASLQVGARTMRLRLTIGTMMDLEDYFGMGLVPFLATRFPEFRLKDMAVLYLAMTSGDFTDELAQKAAAETLVKAGLAEAATAISSCLEATLNPQMGAPGKP